MRIKCRQSEVNLSYGTEPTRFFFHGRGCVVLIGFVHLLASLSLSLSFDDGLFLVLLLFFFLPLFFYYLLLLLIVPYIDTHTHTYIYIWEYIAKASK